MKRSGDQFFCKTCGREVDRVSSKKLLGQRYCQDCISEARSERRRKLKQGTPKRKRKPPASIEVIREELTKSGLSPLDCADIPFRLKRNERVYFLGGRSAGETSFIDLAVTNQRLFYVQDHKPMVVVGDKNRCLRITIGTKTLSVASIISLDVPMEVPRRTYHQVSLHLESGKNIQIWFRQLGVARLFYVLLSELVDRLNDPIDESAFIVKRERISGEVKDAVWRRDNGRCAQCGSRANLEFDHIVPVSKGGSNTLRNVELLCEACNRKKSNRIV